MSRSLCATGWDSRKRSFKNTPLRKYFGHLGGVHVFLKLVLGDFFEHFQLSFNHLDPNAVFTISNSNTEKQFTLYTENRFGATFAQAYYLKWKNFLNQMSKGSALDTEFETSTMTTKIITDIMQKGNKK